jgi:lysophospholipase L1-like esterase
MPSKEELYGAESFPDVLRAVQEVRAELEARHLPVLDLYPVFRELGQERPPFYRVDIHPNELGNQIAADAIAKWIGEEQIFSPPSPPAPSVATAATK